MTILLVTFTHAHIHINKDLKILNYDIKVFYT